MYRYQKRERKYCYLVVESDDISLPVATFDYLVEVVNFLGCSWSTVYYMVNHGRSYHGYRCERVTLE